MKGFIILFITVITACENFIIFSCQQMDPHHHPIHLLSVCTPLILPSVFKNPWSHQLLLKYRSISGNTLYVGLQHAVPPTNTKFKPLFLPTQADIPDTNTHKHRTSYFKSTLTFQDPAKCWKSISV